MTPVTVPALHRVVHADRETSDVITLQLVPADGSSPSAFLPGQFNMLSVPGAGEVAISISGDPASFGPLEHTIRAVGSVTELMLGWHKGQTVGVRGPFGTPWPVEAAADHDVVVVAGGLGVAPLRPLVARLADDPDRHHLAVVVGARRPADLLDIRPRGGLDGHDTSYRVTVDDPDAGWEGAVGVVTALLPEVAFEPGRTVAYVCGPEPMMCATAAALVDRGVAAGGIHVSLERTMRCGYGLCGHCQLGPLFVCRDGPVFAWAAVRELLEVNEL